MGVGGDGSKQGLTVHEPIVVFAHVGSRSTKEAFLRYDAPVLLPAVGRSLMTVNWARARGAAVAREGEAWVAATAAADVERARMARVLGCMA